MPVLVGREKYRYFDRPFEVETYRDDVRACGHHATHCRGLGDRSDIIYQKHRPPSKSFEVLGRRIPSLPRVAASTQQHGQRNQRAALRLAEKTAG